MQDHHAQPAWLYAVAGAVSAFVGAAIGHLVAGAVEPSASPVLAIGSTLIDSTPTPVKEWAIATFGSADKLVLLGSVALVTLLAAVGIGLVARRRPLAAYALLVLLAGVATLAAVLRPTAGLPDVLPGLATAAAGVGVLYLLTRPLRLDNLQEAPESPLDHSVYASDEVTVTNRRAFMIGAAGVTALGAGAGALGQSLAKGAEPVAAVKLPKPTDSLAPLPAGLEGQIPGISTFRTPNSQFYRVDTALTIPNVDAADWKLEIDGMVDRPLTVTFDELLAMPMVEKDITMTCVSNDVGGQYVGAARWLGVPVRTVLERAGVQTGADQILSTSVDGMTISTPVQALTDDRDALLAVAMNGHPLPRKHGYPVRLVTPGLYGFVGSTKWVVKLTATTYAKKTAYWTERGWAAKGPVIPMARIDTPNGLGAKRAGEVVIGGVAWAQQQGIKGVQVQVDGGQWRAARIGPDVNIDYWRQWYLPVDLSSGRHEVTARCITRNGDVQSNLGTQPFPEGASGYHSVVVLID